MFDQLNLRQLILLFFDPRQYWEDAAEQPGTVRSLLVRMLLLAALPGVAVFLSTMLRGIFNGLYFSGYSVAMVSAALVVLFNIGIWILLGLVIDQLANLFDANRDTEQSMKLAAGAVAPVWLGFCLNVIPHSVGFILGSVGSLAGLGYGCYLLYLGLPVMNGTTRDRAATYTVAAMAILFALFTFFMGLAMCTGSCLMGSHAGIIK